MEVLEVQIDGKPAKIEAEPSCLFKVLQALEQAGREVEIREKGRWRRLKAA